jgi:hypothetical protein
VLSFIAYAERGRTEDKGLCAGCILQEDDCMAGKFAAQHEIYAFAIWGKEGATTPSEPCINLLISFKAKYIIEEREQKTVSSLYMLEVLGRGVRDTH